MTDLHRPLRALSALPPGPDLLAACARSAALHPAGRLGVASLGPDNTKWWARDSRDRPSVGGGVATQLLPNLLARVSAPVVAVDLADHAAAAGLSTWELDGLASAVVVPVLDSAGVPCGLVAAFDRVVRGWADDDVAHLLTIADLLAARVHSIEHSAAVREVAAAATELELCVSGGRIHALVDAAREAGDANVQRHASEAQTMLDRAAVLGSRLRSSLRSSALPDPASPRFDLASVVMHATGDAARLYGVAIPNVYGVDRPLSVAGDARQAHAAILRAVSLVLAAVHPDDATVVTATRGSHLATLEGNVVAEVAIDVRGVALGVADLSRVAACQMPTHGPSSGSEQTAGVSISVTGAETRLTTLGMQAVATPEATRVVLSWPVDLG